MTKLQHENLKEHVETVFVFTKFTVCNVILASEGFVTLLQCNQKHLVTEDKVVRPQASMGKQVRRMLYFAFSALTLLFGRQEGHPVSKKPNVGLLVLTF